MISECDLVEIVGLKIFQIWQCESIGLRMEENMIKILGTIFYVQLPIFLKSCYFSQKNPYYRICTGKLQWECWP